MGYCENCGALLGEKARFCEQCGTAVKKEEKIKPRCTHCNAELESGALFCPECGYRVVESEQKKELHDRFTDTIQKQAEKRREEERKLEERKKKEREVAKDNTQRKSPETAQLMEEMEKKFSSTQEKSPETAQLEKKVKGLLILTSVMTVYGIVLGVLMAGDFFVNDEVELWFMGSIGGVGWLVGIGMVYIWKKQKEEILVTQDETRKIQLEKQSKQAYIASVLFPLLLPVIAGMFTWFA